MAYKIDDETLIQDDNRVFNNGCTYISDNLQSPADDAGFFWGVNATLRVASGLYDLPASRIAVITNPTTGYAIGDTNNSGAVDLSDNLNFTKYWLNLSTPPDTLYYANRFIGPAPSNGFNQSDADAGGYLVGWSDEDAYRVLELYVNSGTPAWVTAAFTDSNIAAFADIDDSGAINSSDLTAARNVINGSTSNAAQNANFYKFKGLVCGKFFKTSSTSSSAMWGRGLIGRGNGFNYVAYASTGTITPTVKEISGEIVDTRVLNIYGYSSNGTELSTRYGPFGTEGSSAYAEYDASGTANITVNLPDAWITNNRDGACKVDFIIHPVSNGAILYVDPLDASNNQINVDVSYRSSWAGSDAGSYYNNNSGGIRTSNYGVLFNSLQAGTMYLYSIGGYVAYTLHSSFEFNGAYHMASFSEGKIRDTDLAKLKFRWNTGNILQGSVSTAPYGRLPYV